MRKTAERFPVWDFIEDELQERGWTVDELCERMGGHWSPDLIMRQTMTTPATLWPSVAKDLASAFGTSPDLWLNLAA